MKKALTTGITGQDGSYLTDTLKVIPDLTGFKGKTIYDSSKPDGQPRRRLDTSPPNPSSASRQKSPWATAFLRLSPHTVAGGGEPTEQSIAATSSQ
jgi:hypothetical protein